MMRRVTSRRRGARKAPLTSRPGNSLNQADRPGALFVWAATTLRGGAASIRRRPRADKRWRHSREGSEERSGPNRRPTLARRGGAAALAAGAAEELLTPYFLLSHAVG